MSAGRNCVNLAGREEVDEVWNAISFPGEQGRMKVCHHQQASKVSQSRPVELQGRDGGATGRTFPFDCRSVRSPTKVIVPVVSARMKQGNGFAGYRINSTRLGGLVPVASLTRKSQIFKRDRAAFASRQDMFGREWGRRDSCGRQAILTTKPGAFGHQATHTCVRALRHKPQLSNPFPTSVWERMSFVARQVQ
jgi:hypothetical protein